ncbi:MAG: GGDEF domain-containing protein, partial [Pyrinomonadaceae bacterium]
DLDNLKLINDSYGHAAGDKAIRAVAHAIRSIVRADDLLFRWGGDEFLVLLFGIPDGEARRRLDSLNERLSHIELSRESAPVRVNVSHGLACFDALAHLQHAIEEADGAMYRRKQARKMEQRETTKLDAG